jgi:hypothetical protein
MTAAGVELYWIPLGAGEASPVVRWTGRAFEAVLASRQGRKPEDLYHSALTLAVGGALYVVEMAPAWSLAVAERGVVCEGPVGFRWLGRSRWFRYEVRRWRDGIIPDASFAVNARHVDSDETRASCLLDLVPDVPRAAWGRDELGTGEMWNSNSLISWLLERSGHDTDAIAPPAGGRAPGWRAGLVAAGRSFVESAGQVDLR